MIFVELLILQGTKVCAIVLYRNLSLWGRRSRMAVKAVFVLKLVFVLRFWNLVSTELGRGTLENIWLRIWMFIGGYIVWKFFLPHYAVLFLPVSLSRTKFSWNARGSLVSGGCRINGAYPHNDVAIWKLEPNCYTRNTSNVTK